MPPASQERGASLSMEHEHVPDQTSIRAAGGRGLSLTSVKDASGAVLPNVAVER